MRRTGQKSNLGRKNERIFLKLQRRRFQAGEKHVALYYDFMAGTDLVRGPKEKGRKARKKASIWVGLPMTKEKAFSLQRKERTLQEALKKQRKHAGPPMY